MAVAVSPEVARQMVLAARPGQPAGAPVPMKLFASDTVGGAKTWRAFPVPAEDVAGSLKGGWTVIPAPVSSADAQQQNASAWVTVMAARPTQTLGAPIPMTYAWTGDDGTPRVKEYSVGWNDAGPFLGAGWRVVPGPAAALAPAAPAAPAVLMDLVPSNTSPMFSLGGGGISPTMLVLGGGLLLFLAFGKKGRRRGR